MDILIRSKMVKSDKSHGPSMWLCIDCDYSSKNNSNVYEHIEARHVGSSGYYCQFCDKTCPTRNAFRIHNDQKANIDTGAELVFLGVILL